MAADKVVDNRRLRMGECEFRYDTTEACWRADLSTSRFQGMWCLVVYGQEMSGTLRALPGGATIRKVQLRRGP